MLNFVHGNIFEYPADIRVNTVNCVGVMGAGVALAAKNLYPEMFLAYKKACQAGEVQPGRLNIWKSGNEWIINFPTKRHWREKSRYEDIEAGLIALKSYLKRYGRVRVALPALGCGHGGLDWERVSSMIRHYLTDLDADVFVFEPADSVSIGDRFSSSKTRLRSHETTPTRVDVGANRELNAQGITHVSVLGSPDLLLHPTVAFAVPLKPSEKEKIATVSCMKSIAHRGVTFSLIYEDPDWRSLSMQALAQGANALLWTSSSIRRVKIPAELSDYVSEGRLSVASLFESATTADLSKKRLTNLAQAILARVVLITARGIERSVHEIVEHSRGKPLFFVNYQDAFPEDVRWLRSVGAQPIGRHSTDGSPNVTAILHTLESCRGAAL